MWKIFQFLQLQLSVAAACFSAFVLPLVFRRLLFKLCIQKCRSHLGKDRGFGEKGWWNGWKRPGKVCQRLASHCGFSAWEILL